MHWFFPVIMDGQISLFAGTSKHHPFVFIILLYQSIFLHINNLILNIFPEIR